MKDRPVQRPCRSWLPAGALERPDVDRRLGDALAHWSAKWFVKRAAKTLGALCPQLGLRLGALAPEETVSLGSGAMLTILPATRRALALAMIGLPDRTVAQTVGDRDLIDALSRNCIDDLCCRLGDLFGIAGGVSSGDGTDPILDGWTCDIALGAGSALMRLTIGHDVVVDAIKRALPSKVHKPLQPIASGLMRQNIGISAKLGRCTTTLADFAGLSVGDVLVLDRPAAGPVDLAVDGHPVALVSCAVTLSDGALGLTLHNSFDR